MITDTQTPSAAKLRHVAATIAQDIAHAPIKNRNHKAIQKLNSQLQSMDKTMTATSHTIAIAISHTQDLAEAHRWSSMGANGQPIINTIDQSLATMLGRAFSSKATPVTTSMASRSKHIDGNNSSDIIKHLDSSAEAVVSTSDAAPTLSCLVDDLLNNNPLSHSSVASVVSNFDMDSLPSTFANDISKTSQLDSSVPVTISTRDADPLPRAFVDSTSNMPQLDSSSAAVVSTTDADPCISLSAVETFSIPRLDSPVAAVVSTADADPLLSSTANETFILPQLDSSVAVVVSTTDADPSTTSLPTDETSNTSQLDSAAEVVLADTAYP